MAQGWRPDVINAVVLLSDGRNESDRPSGSLQTLTDDIGHLHHDRPASTFDPRVREGRRRWTLQAISKMTGAHYYDATNPATIERVLGDLVTSSGTDAADGRSEPPAGRSACTVTRREIPCLGRPSS